MSFIFNSASLSSKAAWHFLYFCPLPHQQGSFLPIFILNILDFLLNIFHYTIFIRKSMINMIIKILSDKKELNYVC